MVMEGHAAGSFDDQPEKEEVRRTQPHLGTGLEQERLGRQERDQIGGLVDQAVLVVGAGAIVGNARGVLQKLEDRRLCPGRRQRRQIFADGVANIELLRLVKLEDGDRGEALGQRADVPHRLRRREFVVGQVRTAITGGSWNIGCLDDGHGQTGHVVSFHEFGDALVDEFSLYRQGNFSSSGLRLGYNV